MQDLLTTLQNPHELLLQLHHPRQLVISLVVSHFLSYSLVVLSITQRVSWISRRWQTNVLISLEKSMSVWGLSSIDLLNSFKVLMSCDFVEYFCRIHVDINPGCCYLSVLFALNLLCPQTCKHKGSHCLTKNPLTDFSKMLVRFFLKYNHGLLYFFRETSSWALATFLLPSSDSRHVTWRYIIPSLKLVWYVIIFFLQREPIT